MNIERETQIIKGLFISAKRERYIELVSSKKGRSKLLGKLYHFSDFDPSCVEELSGVNNSADGLIAELRRRGAPDACYVMSIHQETDGVTQRLDDVIRKVFAAPVFEGTIVCCVPGILAYYEGEAPRNRFILHKRSNKPLQPTAEKRGG